MRSLICAFAVICVFVLCPTIEAKEVYVPESTTRVNLKPIHKAYKRTVPEHYKTKKPKNESTRKSNK